MSTGQRVRAGLVRTLIHDPEVVLLDEPTRGLDIAFAGRSGRCYKTSPGTGWS